MNIRKVSKASLPRILLLTLLQERGGEAMVPFSVFNEMADLVGSTKRLTVKVDKKSDGFHLSISK